MPIVVLSQPAIGIVKWENDTWDDRGSRATEGTNEPSSTTIPILTKNDEIVIPVLQSYNVLVRATVSCHVSEARPTCRCLRR